VSDRSNILDGGMSHDPIWLPLFFLRQRLRDFAGLLDEKLRDRANRSVL